MCSLAQASLKVFTGSDTIGMLFLPEPSHMARYAACALRGLYLFTSSAASGDEIERWMRLPEKSEPGTRPYSHFPVVFDFSGFSFSLIVPSQYWQLTTCPFAMRGIICGVPQPPDSGWAPFLSCR